MSRFVILGYVTFSPRFVFRRRDTITKTLIGTGLIGASSFKTNTYEFFSTFTEYRKKKN